MKVIYRMDNGSEHKESISEEGMEDARARAILLQRIDARDWTILKSSDKGKTMALSNKHIAEVIITNDDDDANEPEEGFGLLRKLAEKIAIKYKSH